MGQEETKIRQDGYPIGAVVKLTGLTTHNIRVWEKRHSAVTPQRSPTGRRVYSQNQIERLVLLKKCVECGFSIGEIAHRTDDELRERVNQNLAERTLYAESTYRVGILGSDTLSRKLASLPNLDLAFSQPVRDFSKVHLNLSALDAQADLMVLEIPSLGPADVDSVLALMKGISPTLIVVVYRYASQIQLAALRNQGVKLMKAPVDDDSFCYLISGFLACGIGKPKATLVPPVPSYPAHIFSPQQLDRIASLPTPVECECPHHLVDLLSGLKEFERYSGDCVNKNNEDAALHAKIQITTAMARHQMEGLLQEVLNAEGIEV